MNIISFSDVSMAYNGHQVLSDISFDIEKGEFITMVGRSGCGKTTLLKLINALVTPEKGKIVVNGEYISLYDKVALRRKIGYVIQSIALFPHKTIEDNIAYVPSITNDGDWNKINKTEKCRKLLNMVGLEDNLLKRYPRTLSGGQKQRVGIARALASNPSIILMDEPFGAVDEITREQLQEQLLKIHEERGVTIVFVTHDIAEALKLGTRVMVLEDGRIEQFDKPSEIIETPASSFVKELVNKRTKLILRD